MAQERSLILFAILFALGLACISPLNAFKINYDPGTEDFDKYADGFFNECGLAGNLDKKIFKLALTGYMTAQKDHKDMKPVIAIGDYTQASTQNRFYVVDLEKKSMVFHTLVAHGKQTGENYAKYFSNEKTCLKSSLGFYLTGGTYYGKNGYSLKLIGLEKGYNDTAYERAVVMHGADYVSADFIRKYGRIGRSWGCPALPKPESREIIDYLKNGACLFIYFNDKDYLENSRFLNASHAKVD